MKNVVCVCLLFLSVSSLWATEAVVQAKIEGKTPFQTVQVSQLKGLQTEFLTSVPIYPDNSFRLSLTGANATIYLLQFQSGNYRSQQWLVLQANDSVQLFFTSNYAALRLDSVVGSADMEFLKDYQQRRDTAVLRWVGYEQQLQQLSDEKEKEQVQEAYYQDRKQFQAESARYLMQHPDYLAAALMAYLDFGREFSRHKPLFTTLFEHLGTQYPNNELVVNIGNKLQDPMDVGRIAPEIAAKSPDGKEYKLSDLRGKVVLVDFWASWCRPCRMENPNVVAAYQAYHDKDFEVFSVSLDSSAEAWKAAIEADGLIWPYHVSSLQRWNCPFSQMYGVTGIPFSVLIDREGRIIATGLRGAALQEALIQALE